MLIDIVNIYLSARRDAGFKLDEVEKYLSSYANFAESPVGIPISPAKPPSSGHRKPHQRTNVQAQ